MLGNSADWRAQVDHFRRNYSVIALDLPGHGQRTTSQPAEQQWDIPNVAQDIITQITALAINQPIILIAHSLAVRIAIELGYLLKEQVTGLVLLDMGYQSSPSITFQWLQKEQKTIRTMGYNTWLQHFFDTKFGPTTPASLRQEIMKTAHAIDPSIGIALHLNTKIYDFYALEKTMRLINAPTLILQSSFYHQGTRQEIEAPTIPPSDWLSLVKTALPNAQIKAIPNCGHWLMREQPELCNSMIEMFLKTD